MSMLLLSEVAHDHGSVRSELGSCDARKTRGVGRARSQPLGHITLPTHQQRRGGKRAQPSSSTPGNSASPTCGPEAPSRSNNSRLVNLIGRDLLMNEDLSSSKFAMNALADFCTPKAGNRVNVEVNRRNVIQLGGHEAVVASMERFPDNLFIQSQGCLTLQNLTVGKRDSRVREAIASAGGIKAIVGAMYDFPRDAAMQRNAAGALQNLACNTDANKRLIAGSGGIRPLIDAMQNHPECSEILLWSCGALAYLAAATDERIKEAIVLCGGLETIAKVIRLNYGNKVVVRMASKAMVALMPSFDDN